MRYWWVNQNQTYRQEVAGGYLWSPKRNADGTTSHFYECMREVAPGDVVFSFVDTKIFAIGIVRSFCWESPKPREFGSVGENWDGIGWRVRVQFTPLVRRIRPREHMDVLRSVLPARYSPIQANGNGNQIYLTELPEDFAQVLARIIGSEAQLVIDKRAFEAQAAVQRPTQGDDLDDWEHRLENQIEADGSVPETERAALIRSRRGQGLFKDRVLAIERRCRITHVDTLVHLIASHCKPWRDSNNEERLDGENGLLLTPSIDHLFDRGFIGFEDSGTLIISPVANRLSLERMGVETRMVVNVGGFTSGQRKFLDFHRDSVLLRASR